MNTQLDNQTEVAALLDEPVARPLWRRPRVWIAGVLVIAAAAALWAWRARSEAAAAQPSFVTEAVTRGQLSVAVSANGTLQPTHSVNIGSELSGTVARVLVDVNDRVKKGQVLVELDTAKLRDQVARSRATLASSQAKVAQADATVKESQGNLARLEEVSARRRGADAHGRSRQCGGRLAAGRHAVHDRR